MTADKSWFQDARYGLFIHYGLYSILARGEWVMNREQVPLKEYGKLAGQFTAENFDADDLVRRAKEDWGMRYAVLTTKHHDGFCLYDSDLSGFTAPKSAAKRDLVAEYVEACRKHGMKIGLYHSLNDWSASPSAVDALERGAECYHPFIEFVHGQIREIMTKYGKVDIMWYDGWWPFDGQGWKARELNAMVRELQPGILINGRCGLPGDFATPEGHIAAQKGMWEACMCLNDSWGYHKGDNNWKAPKTVAGMLRQVSSGQGNLLLNVGPKGDGSVPEETVRILDRVGEWLKANGEAIFDTIRFRLNLRQRGDERSDFTNHGSFTATDDAFYLHATRWPGSYVRVAGVECDVKEVSLLESGQALPFEQRGTLVEVTGMPETVPGDMPVVIRFRTKQTPLIYHTAGMRVPTVPHCRYDPIASDIQN